jgi:ankyrin repeat protein
MNIGRSAPRFQKMALLYPQSKLLQSHLSEYFILVVNFCHHLWTFAQKSGLKQFTSALNDSNLKVYESNLELWANAIKEEVHILMARKINDDGHKIIGVTEIVTSGFAFISHQRNQQNKLRILEYCSTYEFQSAWKQIRKVGNSTLFQENSEYEAWKKQTESCTIIVSGKVGSGKSVLLANVVDDLSFWNEDKTIPVAYFFCRHDVPESLRSRTVLGSLARQLLLPIRNFAPVSELIDEATVSLDAEGILDLLRRTLPSSSKAYFVLDGLDEFDSITRTEVIQYLHTLQKFFKFHIRVSLRLEPANIHNQNVDQFALVKTIFMPDSNPDIKAYIEAELESRVQTGKLKMGDPALILEIQDALIDGSEGMFLWVTLQLESLCLSQTDNAIRHALKDLPKGLSETFSRILQRSKDPGKLYTRRILELVTVARRPLTMEELREGLSVTPGNTEWSSSNLINEMLPVLGYCGGLVLIDEEEFTAHLVHHSFKQFLLDGLQDTTGMKFTLDDANKTTAEAIVTYLNYGVFENRLSTAVVPIMEMGSLPAGIIRSALDNSSIRRKLVLKYLRSRESAKFDIGKTVTNASNDQQKQAAEDFHYYDYAKSNCIQHALCTTKQEPKFHHLFLSLLQADIVSANAELEDGRTPLSWAVEKGHEVIIRLLLESNKIDHEIENYTSSKSLLSWAMEGGHELIIRLLIETKKIGAEFTRSLLSWAMEMPSEDIVRSLFASAQFDAKLREQAFIQPVLSWAMDAGYDSIIRSLLETHKIDAIFKDHALTLLVLSWAVKAGHDSIATLMLEDEKVQFDFDNEKLHELLLWWIAEKKPTAVIMLLHVFGKIDINAKDDTGETPLLLAVLRGNAPMVQLLIKTNRVAINSRDYFHRTPLHWAAIKGHDSIVKLLLNAYNVQVDAKDELLRTPLIWATCKGHTAVVKLLLETKQVSINIGDNYNRTPLFYAAFGGHEAVVRLLLKTNQVLVHSQDIYYRTPLSWAEENGHDAIVKLLKLVVRSQKHKGQRAWSVSAEMGDSARDP